MLTLPDQSQYSTHDLWAKAEVFREFNLGVEPELRFTLWASNMHMRPPLFSREEVES
jgi:hypothetical protein